MKEFTDRDLEQLFSELQKYSGPTVSFQEKLLGKLKRRWVFMGMKKSILETTPNNIGFFRKNVLGLSVLSVLFVSTGIVSTFAYESNAVTEQSVLYPVKRVIEGVEQNFATTPESNIEYHLKMMQRRLSEAQYLSEEGLRDEQTLSDFDQHFELGIQAVMNLSDKNKKTEYLNRFEQFIKDGKLQERLDSLKNADISK